MKLLTAQTRLLKIVLISLLMIGLMPAGGCRIAGSPPEISLVGEAAFPGTAPELIAQPAKTLPGPDDAEEDSSARSGLIVCEIKGQVAVPGVYDLARDSRVADLIIRSGGVLPTGSLDFVNQARKLSDGEVVVIPGKEVSREEFDAMAVPGPSENQTPSDSSPENPQGLININTATEAELDTIPGVGPATARNIIAHRTEQGPFTVIEDLKKVDRIGEKTFDKLKSHITVNP